VFFVAKKTPLNPVSTINYKLQPPPQPPQPPHQSAHQPRQFNQLDHHNTMKTHIKHLALTGFLSLTLAALAAPAQNTFPAAGNVGIGTIWPQKPLEVSNGHIIRVDYTHYDGGKISFHTDGGGHSLGFGVHGRGYSKYWKFVDARGREFFTVKYLSGDATVFGKLFVPNGNVGIGTQNPTHKLTVSGAIRAKEVIVDTGWADDVFSKDYKLLTLAETENYIQNAGRLPGIPSAEEVQDKGVNVGETQSMLLRKIEELTLHMIRMGKRVADLEAENAALKAR
jgi:hypothetical protein